MTSQAGSVKSDDAVDGHLQLVDQFQQNPPWTTEQFMQVRESLLQMKPSGISRAEPATEEVIAEVYLEHVRRRETSKFQGSSAWNVANFPPARPFHQVRDEITKSPSFELMRQLPKGGLLHVHSSSAGRASWIVTHLSDFDNCYINWSGNEQSIDHGKLGFFHSSQVPAGYTSADELKKNVKDLEEKLLARFVIQQESFNPWNELMNINTRLGAFMSHQPANFDYLVDALEGMVDDGIDYVEMRVMLGEVRNLEGRVWRDDEFIQQFVAIRDHVQKSHPDFDLKIIVSDYRGKPSAEVEKSIDWVFEMRRRFPDFVVGFDLVGQETSQNQTIGLIQAWEYAARQESVHQVDFPLFLHDGETGWVDNSDVLDAFLLGSRRIGHGLNLYAYPHVEKLLTVKDVALEVCPISNQELGYVSDLRIHPASGYVRRGVPCVLASDDPLVFGNHGLSYDFWVAWMAWSLKLSELRTLAYNSLKYSSMNTDEKSRAIDRWESKWQQFVVAVADRAHADPEFSMQ